MKEKILMTKRYRWILRYDEGDKEACIFARSGRESRLPLKLRGDGLGPKLTFHTTKVNMGKLCNQACVHCHVEAGPKRTEIMNISVVQQILKLLRKKNNIKVVDITGGAPELNSNFKYFIKELSSLNLKIIDRCNLTVLHEKGQDTETRIKTQQKATKGNKKKP